MKKKIAVVAIAAAGLFGLTGCSDGKVDQFRVACTDREGVVVVTDLDSWGGVRFDCLVDGEIVYIPGFEG